MGSFSGQIAEAAGVVRAQWDSAAWCGLILGTGLGSLAEAIEAECVIPYDQIPHFPRATALSHAGRLVCGKLAGRPVVAMEGRCHLYEGYGVAQIVLPVYVMQRLGCRWLVISNASGGLNPHLRAGDIVLVEDHINLMWSGPPGADRASRPGLVEPYDRQLMRQVQRLARQAGFDVRRGVYAGVVGPNYETRAEYRWLRRMGADVVGMSTVPEALAAADCGLPVLGLSVVSNVANPDALHTVTGVQVVDAAQLAEPRLRTIVLGLLSQAELLEPAG